MLLSAFVQNPTVQITVWLRIIYDRTYSSDTSG
jgi:hypothetical protein